MAERNMGTCMQRTAHAWHACSGSAMAVASSSASGAWTLAAGDLQGSESSTPQRRHVHPLEGREFKLSRLQWRDPCERPGAHSASSLKFQTFGRHELRRGPLCTGLEKPTASFYGGPYDTDPLARTSMTARCLGAAPLGVETRASAMHGLVAQ